MIEIKLHQEDLKLINKIKSMSKSLGDLIEDRGDVFSVDYEVEIWRFDLNNMVLTVTSK